MIRKDYIMRQLEELAKLLAILLKLKTEKKTEEAMSVLKEAYAGLLQMDEALFDKEMKGEEFLRAIDAEGKENDALHVLAELLYEDGIMRYEQQLPNAFLRLHKSLFLYHYLNQHSVTFSFDRSMKMAKIEEYLTQR